MTDTTSDKPHELADYQWLVGATAEEILSQSANSQESLPVLASRLRRVLSAARAHLVLEHIELRRRAADKFAGASRMFFTRRGLEQATDEVVARYKATRFAGRAQTIDLCCGIGGDLIALAAQTRAIGVDRDAIMALLATANLAAAGIGEANQASVETVEVTSVDVGACAAWHIDPDRRPRGRRTTQVELHEPPPEVIDRLLAVNGNAAIKLAPAAVLPPHWSEAAEQEWISRKGECRQLVAWFGDLTSEAGRRRATIVSHHGAPRSIVGSDAAATNTAPEVPSAERVGRFLFEPDAAVLAAKLEATLAAEHQLAAVTPGIAYWTADSPIQDAALACFQTLEVLPLDRKTLRSLLQARRIGKLEIKKRGVDLDPAELRKQLKPAGDESATLIILPIEGQPTAVLARRF